MSVFTNNPVNLNSLVRDKNTTPEYIIKINAILIILDA
jgi:hypothetical protein